MKINEKMKSGVLEARLSSAIEKNLQFIKLNSQNFASKKLPSVQGDLMKSYFEEEHLRYQHLLDEVNKELQFKTTLQQVADHTRTTDEQVNYLNNQQTAAKEKLIAAEHRLNQMPRPKHANRMVLALFGIGIISSFEGLVAMPFYEHYGYSSILSTLLGLLFAVVLGFLAYFFLHVVSWGKTVWQQWLIAIIFIVFLVVLFRFIAGPRADYLNSVVSNGDTNSDEHFSAWPFVAISMLLFFTSVAIKYFVMPDKKERDDLKDYQETLHKKEAFEIRIGEIEAEKLQIQQENNDLKASSASLLEYGYMLEESIINHAKSGYALWKKHNLMHRPDKFVPDCFGQPYPFTFHTNFHLIKSMNHEVAH